MQEIRNMPIGIQSFEAMRQGSYVYVDKTHFIPKLEVLGRAYFLTHPRRFGKSLFISTLEAYFKARKELFKGLALEKYKAENGEDWQVYLVLKLDLNANEYTEKGHLKAMLKNHIEGWYKDYNVKLNSIEPSSAFATLIKCLYEKFNQKVVILIDEYDKPLIATLENKELYKQYRLTLKAFYSVIKSSNDYIHLSFLTGVSKFSKVSIFSDLNNLDDISFSDKYSSICGITEQELKEHFSPEIESLAQEFEMSYNEMFALLRQKYDGYRFSRNEMRIYNPFSLCNVLEKKELGNYWFETGTPYFLVHLLENEYFDIPDLEGNIEFSLDEMDEYRIDYENPAPLLFQTGYLTIKDYDKDSFSCILGYPNDEVKYALLKRLMKVYTSARTGREGIFKIKLFKDAMQKGDIETVLTLIKALMASIPYDSLPKDKLFLREHNYQTTIYLIFTLMGEYVKTEVHSSKGRSDVEVETSNAIYIFEFKVEGEPLEAIAQIKEAGYSEKHTGKGKNIFLIDVSISQNERALECWQIEKYE